jgi:hypothetical protein
MIRGPRPLRDHVATVSAYLNHYKLQTDLQKQGEDSFKFTNYLISTCWPKIVRRIGSWQAMGFMFLAQAISAEVLHMFGSTWNGFGPAGPGDRTLMSYQRGLNNKLKERLLLEGINDGMLNYTKDDFPVMFSVNPELTLTKETTQEFHKLTVAAFNGFAITFFRLKKADEKLVGGINY